MEDCRQSSLTDPFQRWNEEGGAPLHPGKSALSVRAADACVAKGVPHSTRVLAAAVLLVLAAHAVHQGFDEAIAQGLDGGVSCHCGIASENRTRGSPSQW